METKQVKFLKIDYRNTTVKSDVLIVNFKDGRFWLCDKEFGIIDDIENPNYFIVKRVFGVGGRHGKK